jgi:uncharacterized protein (DUF1499 family)
MKFMPGYLTILFFLIIAGLAVLLLTPLGVWPLDRVFSVGRLETIDFQRLELSDKPNQFLACPSDYCRATPQLESPIFDLSADQLQKKWLDIVTKEPRVTVLDANENQQFDFVQRSARLRFPDIITVKFIALTPERSTLAIYSRSVYGHSDFGVNRQRALHWLDKVSRNLKGE